MSFAAQTKKELTMIESEACCEQAELSALIRMLGAVQLSNKKSSWIFRQRMLRLQEGHTLLKSIFKCIRNCWFAKNAAEEEQRIYCSRSVYGPGDFEGSADRF